MTEIFGMRSIANAYRQHAKLRNTKLPPYEENCKLQNTVYHSLNKALDEGVPLLVVMVLLSLRILYVNARMLIIVEDMINSFIFSCIRGFQCFIIPFFRPRFLLFMCSCSAFISKVYIASINVLYAFSFFESIKLLTLIFRSIRGRNLAERRRMK